MLNFSIDPSGLIQDRLDIKLRCGVYQMWVCFRPVRNSVPIKSDAEAIMTRTFGIFVAFLALAVLPARAGSVVVGLPAISHNGNCIPFACSGFFGITTYQQVYNSTAFSSSIDIGNIAFFNTEVLGGMPGGGTYSFSLSYTSAAAGGLNLTNPLDNIGSGSRAFFSGSLPSLSSGMLDFSGTPFLYNPTLGNLLLTVTVSGATEGSLFLDEAASQSVTGRAWFGETGGGNDLGGLVTEFSTATATTTPEPSSLLLFGSVLIGAAGMARRKLLSR
jgi:PEP-CTERM motif